MFNRLHERLGTAGLVVAVVALIAALAGTAFAAAGLNSKQKKEVKSIARSFQGTGPQGPAGANGTNGTNGKDGSNGTNGATGPKGATGPTGATGATGATGVGTTGPTGNIGSVLLTGQSETGAWSMVGSTSDTAGLTSPISFPIPLAAELDSAHVHYVTAPAGSCTGTAAAPTAESGHLCVYQGFLIGVAFSANPIAKPTSLTLGAAKTGAVLSTEVPSGPAIARGTWAVTAP